MSSQKKLLLLVFTLSTLLAVALIKRSVNKEDAVKDTATNNLLMNPGFESGREGWSDFSDSELWGEFRIADNISRTGGFSVHLPVDSSGANDRYPIQVYGAVQEIDAKPFPHSIGGSYWVDRYINEADASVEQPARLYLQVVVIVNGDPQAPTLLAPGNENGTNTNYQIRYYLGGADQPAYEMPNAKVRMVSTEPPRLKEWVRFSLPIREDMRTLWGVVPKDYTSLRVLFEARWDRKPKGTLLQADVYYDDLSVIPD